MRLISLLTAAVVITALYFLVFQREALLEFAGRDAVEQVEDAGVQADAAETMPEEVEGAVGVVAQRSRADMIDSGVILRGRTEAVRQVDVRAEISGLVISEPLRRGARVEADQVLCRLDPGTRIIALTEAEARRSEASAQLKDAEINLTAAERLSNEGFAAETRVTAAVAAVQSARAGVQSAEAGIAAAQKNIERLEIKAPFAGILETDGAEIGSLLQPGSLCATVIQLDPMKLVGYVPETQVDRVQIGAPAGARLASGREVLGRVTFLSRSADPETRTFRAEVEVSNSDEAIRDGQTAEILISADGAHAHLLPQSALTLNNDGRLGVRLVDENNLVAFAPVSVLRDTTEGIWVGGLEQEVDVIVVGQEYVTAGVPVRATYRETAE